jgi:putative hemolysin
LSIQILDHIFLLFILFSLSFLFSASETALFSLPRVAIDRLKHSSAGGKQLANLLKEPNRLLVTILIGNLGANILISAIIGAWVLRMLEPIPYSIYVGSIAAIILTTTLLLLIAEITPKTLAINAPERFATTVAIPLALFSKIIYPVLRIIQFLTDSILRLFGIRNEDSRDFLTEKQLKTMLAMGEEEGVIETNERLMIHRIFEFGDTLVRDVFVPRTDVVRVQYGTTVEQLIRIMKESGHSRFPVYGRTIDDIKGIVYAKDLFPHFWREQFNVPISHFIRPARYVPETKRVYELLREFQSGRIHMAVVVGEYGGMKGIVTLEDLIKEVVGDIFDEYDVKTKKLERLPDGSIRIDARLYLDDLSNILGADMHLSGCETVSGLAYKLLERTPVQNDRVEHNGFRFLIEEMKNRRIRTILISPASGYGPKSGGEMKS